MLTNDYKIERPIYKTPEQPRTQIHEYPKFRSILV